MSLADAQLNGELFGTRANGRRQLDLGIYRRLEASNDYGDPLSFGSSLNALLFGLDEGFYYRTWGGELSDRIGRRRVIIGGWSLYALTYLAFGFASRA